MGIHRGPGWTTFFLTTAFFLFFGKRGHLSISKEILRGTEIAIPLSTATLSFFPRNFGYHHTSAIGTAKRAFSFITR